MADELGTASQKNYGVFLFAQLQLVEQHFKWLQLSIKGKLLNGSGMLNLYGRNYLVEVNYSPFFEYRFDRIYIKGITYHKKIHVYPDVSLCLYHPIQDMPLLKTIALADMIPWISEWCVHYQEWKKYGVWLGREIAHE